MVELALPVVAGGVILLLAAVFVYVVVSPATRARAPLPPAHRMGRPCVYCRSTHTRRLGAPNHRHDDHGFAMITAYECVRCGLPFWSVERSPAEQRSR